MSNVEGIAIIIATIVAIFAYIYVFGLLYEASSEWWQWLNKEGSAPLWVKVLSFVPLAALFLVIHILNIIHIIATAAFVYKAVKGNGK